MSLTDRRPSEDAITNMLQDVGEACASTVHDFGNRDLFFTEANISDWRRLYADLESVMNKLDEMVERSRTPEPTPAEYIPIYGVTNGRGRVIA